MAQQTFDEVAPHQAHSETSRAASEAVAPHLSRLQQRVLDYIVVFGPITDSRLIDTISDLSPNTIRPRRIELARMGLVVQDGTVTQPNGRKAAVWKAK